MLVRQLNTQLRMQPPYLIVVLCLLLQKVCFTLLQHNLGHSQLSLQCNSSTPLELRLRHKSQRPMPLAYNFKQPAA